MSRSDWIALFLSFLAILAAYLVADRVFERMPHLEDEIAYVWQARLTAAGQVTMDTPPLAKKFLIPFVVDYQGKRFGKYPLGWPVLLGVGVKLGVRDWVNPLLAGLAVWLTYRLGQKLMGEAVGLLAAGLTLVSPFFLVNSGSLLAHPFGLVLSLAFVIAWWDAVGEGRGWLAAVTAGLVLGVLGLARPFSALAVAFPFGVCGVYVLVRGPAAARARVLLIGGIALLVAGLHFVWQYAATGDAWLNPYTLWWPYDRIGFGPGVGVTEGGHNLRLAWINTRHSLRVGASDLFGWPGISWIFLPFGVWAARRNGRMLLTGSVVVSLLVFYLAYWIGAWLFGPRYQFEGLYSLTLLSAAGIAWLGGWLPGAGQGERAGGRGAEARAGGASGPGNGDPARSRFRPLGVAALVALLIALNLVFYLPQRLNFMYGLYGISRARMAPFETPEAQALTPAVIIVHADRWMDYGALLELEDPFLTTPFIFTFGDQPGLAQVLRQLYPERGVYHYYPDEPYRFYTGERPLE